MMTNKQRAIRTAAIKQLAALEIEDRLVEIVDDFHQELYIATHGALEDTTDIDDMDTELLDETARLLRLRIVSIVGNYL